MEKDLKEDAIQERKELEKIAKKIADQDKKNENLEASIQAEIKKEM